MDTIRTVETTYLAPHGWLPADWEAIPLAERCMRLLEQRSHGQLRYGRPYGVDLGGTPAYARLNYGRWLVECPCGEAQIVSPHDPRFFCFQCANGGTRLWRNVIWPDPPHRAAIERDALAVDERARNWAHPADRSPVAVLTRSVNAGNQLGGGR